MLGIVTADSDDDLDKFAAADDGQRHDDDHRHDDDGDDHDDHPQVHPELGQRNDFEHRHLWDGGASCASPNCRH